MTDPEPPECTEASCGAPAPPMTERRFATVAKALAHPARLRILEQFTDHRPRTVSDIVVACSLAQSTVSEHLRIMRHADIVFARRDGPRTWYCMRRSVLADFARAAYDLTLDLELVAPSPISGR